MDSNMIIGGRVETLTTENCTAEDLAAMVAKVLAKNHAEGTLTLNEGNIVMDMYDDFGIDFCSVVRRLHLGTVSRFLTSEACSAFIEVARDPRDGTLRYMTNRGGAQFSTGVNGYHRQEEPTPTTPPNQQQPVPTRGDIWDEDGDDEVEATIKGKGSAQPHTSGSTGMIQQRQRPVRDEGRRLVEHTDSNEESPLMPGRVVGVEPVRPHHQQHHPQQQENYPSTTAAHHNTCPRREEQKLVRSNPSVIEASPLVVSRPSRETELKKLGKLIDTILKFHSPRILLLDDLIKTLEVALEPRFANIEGFAGMDYGRYIDRYCCKDVEVMVSRDGYLNLYWNGPK